MNNVKIAVCGLWIAFLSSFFLFTDFQESRGQSVSSPSATPDIEAFDKAIQQRFLTEPFFGIARMAPTEPQPLRSIHVGSFHPVNDEERSLLSAFIKNNWKVGLYLFGRTAVPKVNKKDPIGKFTIKYRLNEPVHVTDNSVKAKLPNAKKLIEEVKTAFLVFQAQNSTNVESYRFKEGDWTYVAKPVRAVNQSCITCHTDFVITEKLAGDKFKLRKRMVGDVNGVIVYAYSKDVKK